MKKRFILAALAAVTAVSITCGLSYAAVDAEEQSVSATYVATDTTSGATWYKYGTAGYVVLAGDKKEDGKNRYRDFYSDMYTNKGIDGYTAIYPRFNTGTGYVADTEFNDKDGTVYYDYASGDYGLDDYAPISKWGLTTSQWGWTAADDGNGTIYLPGVQFGENVNKTKANIQYGAFNQKNGASVFFTLKTEEEIYATFAVQGGGGNIDVNVYNTEIIKNNGPAMTSSLAEAVTVVGDDKTPVFVTYKLKGAGQYQIAATRGTDNTNGQVAISAFFFDKSVSVSAECVKTDTTTGKEWEGVYGKDGYIVLASDVADENAENIKRDFYSDMYKNKGNDGKTAIFPRFSSAGMTKNGTVYYSADTFDYGLDETAPISKWGLTTNQWGTATSNGNPDTILTPGNGKSASPDIGYGKIDDKNCNSVFFTLNTTKEVFVTVAIKIEKIDADLNVDIYNCEVLNNGGKKGFAKQLVDTVKLTTIGSQTSYVTYKLGGAGRYQIFPTFAENGGQPAIHGIFFDFAEEESFVMKQASLSLKGDIGLNLYAKINDDDVIGKEVTLNVTDIADNTVTELPIGEKGEDGLYKFTVNVSPRNYASDLDLQFYANGEAVGKKVTYSVNRAIETVLNASSGTYTDKMVALCASLKEYCAAADAYFNGAEYTATDDVAAVKAEDLAGNKASQSGTKPEGITKIEISLSLKSETTIRLYITADEKLSESWTKSGENTYYLEISGISAKSLAATQEFNITDEYKVTCTALSYAYGVLTNDNSSEKLVNLSKTLYLYSVAAANYFI